MAVRRIRTGKRRYVAHRDAKRNTPPRRRSTRFGRTGRNPERPENGDGESDRGDGRFSGRSAFQDRQQRGFENEDGKPRARKRKSERDKESRGEKDSDPWSALPPEQKRKRRANQGGGVVRVVEPESMPHDSVPSEFRHSESLVRHVCGGRKPRPWLAPCGRDLF